MVKGTFNYRSFEAGGMLVRRHVGMANVPLNVHNNILCLVIDILHSRPPSIHFLESYNCSPAFISQLLWQ